MNPQRPIRLALVTLGCAKNLVDTEVMAGSAATAGLQLTDDADTADVLLINTCSFIADARAEAESRIAAGLRWKRAAPGRWLVVAGCLPQRGLPEVRARYPGVDLFVGLDDVPHTAERLGALLAGETCATAAAEAFPLPRYLYDERTPRLLLTPPGFAYVKIADGCNHGCRFCSIPAIRGRQRSRPLPSVLAECRQLLDQGVSELILIAQDTTRYGHDLRDGHTTLAALLREIEQIDGRFWVRVMYTHPRHLTDDVLELFAAGGHLVPYIDVPLQHISDHVLHDMGRGLGEPETRALLQRIRARVPGAVVRTAFIVGYPGETAADFAALRDLVRDYRFERLGVFVFSPEAGTPAADLRTGLVPLPLAQARRAELMELQQAISLARNQALVDQTLDVLLDGPRDGGWSLGRTTADAPDVDNAVRVRLPARRHAAGFLRVRITEAEPYDLRGVPA